jgi:acetyl/propionyl-CoA carboxylase alpha subunit
VEPSTRDFYFLEMNTRIQVEHPITEMVTGVDLVQWQIRVAAGETLAFTQKDLRQDGHAIEARIYAEDPANGFLPQTGWVLKMAAPTAPDIRLDTGVSEGGAVGTHYDPLLAKLIVYAENRSQALDKIISALKETVILGVVSNTNFLQDLVAHPAVKAGQYHTHFVENSMDDLAPAPKIPTGVLLAAALVDLQPVSTQTRNEELDDPFSLWRSGNRFRLGERQ